MQCSSMQSLSPREVDQSGKIALSDCCMLLPGLSCGHSPADLQHKYCHPIECIKYAPESAPGPHRAVLCHVGCTGHSTAAGRPQLLQFHARLQQLLPHDPHTYRCSGISTLHEPNCICIAYECIRGHVISALYAFFMKDLVLCRPILPRLHRRH